MIFSYIRRLGPMFLGLECLNYNILWGFSKMNIFWYDKIVDIFVVITKLDYFWGHFYTF